MAYNLPTLMPGYGNAFGRGLILGTGAALLYMAARDNCWHGPTLYRPQQTRRRRRRPFPE